MKVTLSSLMLLCLSAGCQSVLSTSSPTSYSQEDHPSTDAQSKLTGGQRDAALPSATPSSVAPSPNAEPKSAPSNPPSPQSIGGFNPVLGFRRGAQRFATGVQQGLVEGIQDFLSGTAGATQRVSAGVQYVQDPTAQAPQYHQQPFLYSGQIPQDQVYARSPQYTQAQAAPLYTYNSNSGYTRPPPSSANRYPATSLRPNTQYPSSESAPSHRPTQNQQYDTQLGGQASVSHWFRKDHLAPNQPSLPGIQSAASTPSNLGQSSYLTQSTAHGSTVFPSSSQQGQTLTFPSHLTSSSSSSYPATSGQLSSASYPGSSSSYSLPSSSYPSPSSSYSLPSSSYPSSSSSYSLPSSSYPVQSSSYRMPSSSYPIPPSYTGSSSSVLASTTYPYSSSRQLSVSYPVGSPSHSSSYLSASSSESLRVPASYPTSLDESYYGTHVRNGYGQLY